MSSPPWDEIGEFIGIQPGENLGSSIDINSSGDRIISASAYDDTETSGVGRALVYGYTQLFGGSAGEEKRVKYILSEDTFSTTIGTGGVNGQDGGDTILTVGGTNIIVQGGKTNTDTVDGDPGYYNGYGAGGAAIGGRPGSSKASVGTGADGRIIVRYS